MKIGNYQSMEKDHHLFDCFECGCCTFVCPSHIPLVQQFRIAKGSDSKREEGRWMSASPKTLAIRSSPHIGGTLSTDSIMFHVVLALFPVSVFAVYLFGLAALLVLVTAVASCVLTEHLLCRLSGQVTTVGDWSVVITGLLYGLVLPPSLPLWMVAAGGVIGVGLGKFLFGGLGSNPFNPALVGRAILQAAFPAAMTTWPASSSGFASLPSSTLALPLTKPVYDGISAATPLSDWKFNQIATDTSDLFLGTVSGSTGETSYC